VHPAEDLGVLRSKDVDRGLRDGGEQAGEQENGEQTISDKANIRPRW
jgi:hypothetical protein